MEQAKKSSRGSDPKNNVSFYHRRLRLRSKRKAVKLRYQWVPKVKVENILPCIRDSRSIQRARVAKLLLATMLSASRDKQWRRKTLRRQSRTAKPVLVDQPTPPAKGMTGLSQFRSSQKLEALFGSLIRQESSGFHSKCCLSTRVTDKQIALVRYSFQTHTVFAAHRPYVLYSMTYPGCNRYVYGGDFACGYAFYLMRTLGLEHHFGWFHRRYLRLRRQARRIRECLAREADRWRELAKAGRAPVVKEPFTIGAAGNLGSRPANQLVPISGVDCGVIPKAIKEEVERMLAQGCSMDALVKALLPDH